jgi:hypothetical protein
MPSSAHQTLLLWLVRKMSADGFCVAACDGTMPRGGAWSGLPRPLPTLGVRPDAYAVSPNNGAFAFAEAKTEDDIIKEHTRRQLRNLGQIVMNGGARCRLYVAVPRSAALVLDRVIHESGLTGTHQLVRMHVPDCLVEE